MTKHTKGLLIAGQYSSVVGMPIVGQLGTVICNMATMPAEHPHQKEINEVAQANAERLTACWNAMQGIDDPAAFMLADNSAAIERLSVKIELGERTGEEMIVDLEAIAEAIKAGHIMNLPARLLMGDRAGIIMFITPSPRGESQ